MEVKRMKGKLIFLVLLIASMASTTVNTALAETYQTDHEHAGVNCNINVEGQPLIRLVAYGQMVGDYYSGNGHADRLQILVHTGSYNPTTGLPVFKYVAGYEDNPTRSAFSVSLGLGTVEYVVEPGQIQVLRVGKSSTIKVHWNIPLVCPATTASSLGGATPAVTIPPGKLVVEGFGDSKPLAVSSWTTIGTTGWKYKLEATYHSGTATLFCVGWDCKWIPVGDAFAGSSQEVRSIDDRIWYWYHP
jgi:hypothetical protein